MNTLLKRALLGLALLAAPAAYAVTSLAPAADCPCGASCPASGDCDRGCCKGGSCPTR